MQHFSGSGLEHVIKGLGNSSDCDSKHVYLDINDLCQGYEDLLSDPALSFLQDANTAWTSTSSSISPNEQDEKSSSGSATDRDEEDEKERGDLAVKMAISFVRALDQRNLASLDSLLDPECDVHFGEIHMHIEDYLNEIRRLYDSFPDLIISWHGMTRTHRTARMTGESQVSLNFFQYSGTHLGKPYAFEPYPEVPAEGNEVVTNPEQVLFEFKNGKLVDLTFMSTGELCGLPGVYRLVGGFPMY